MARISLGWTQCTCGKHIPFIVHGKTKAACPYCYLHWPCEYLVYTEHTFDEMDEWGEMDIDEN